MIDLTPQELEVLTRGTSRLDAALKAKQEADQAVASAAATLRGRFEAILEARGLEPGDYRLEGSTSGLPTIVSAPREPLDQQA